MIGLLKNDFYCLIEEEFVAILMVITVTVASITLQLSAPGAFLASFFLISLTYRTVSIDWDIFIDATPLNRRTIVLEKYIFCCVIVFLAAIVAFIISYFNVGNMVMSCAMPELVKTMIVVLIYGLYDVALTLFISFVFGKNRIIIVNTLIKLLFAIIVTMLSIKNVSINETTNVNRMGINVFSFIDVPWMYFGTIMVMVIALYITSFIISANIYDKREFT